MRQVAYIVLFCLTLGQLQAQGSFSPQAGETGSDAIPATSELFRYWATDCQIERGYKHYEDKDAGLVGNGHVNYALGEPDAPLVLTLGDSGVAVVQFWGAVYNGDGADFAVFENGFGSGGSAFLELAFVEVSSDGEHFFRFPALTDLPPERVVGTFDHLDASHFHNLAGKYISGYGVPFDLDDIPDTSALDKGAVTHVRIVDVIGIADSTMGSYDSEGHLIRDPYPTNFEQGGFDLDAIGVIHSTVPLMIQEPNPIGFDSEKIHFDLLGRQIPTQDPGILQGNKGVITVYR